MAPTKKAAAAAEAPTKKATGAATGKGKGKRAAVAHEEEKGKGMGKKAGPTRTPGRGAAASSSSSSSSAAGAAAARSATPAKKALPPLLSTVRRAPRSVGGESARFLSACSVIAHTQIGGYVVVPVYTAANEAFLHYLYFKKHDSRKDDDSLPVRPCPMPHGPWPLALSSR